MAVPIPRPAAACQRARHAPPGRVRSRRRMPTKLQFRTSSTPTDDDAEININPDRRPYRDPAREALAAAWTPSPASWEPWRALAGASLQRLSDGLRTKAYYLFEAAYLGELRARLLAEPRVFAAMLADNYVVLACACPWPDLCPRHIAATALTQLGATYLGDMGSAPPRRRPQPKSNPPPGREPFPTSPQSTDLGSPGIADDLRSMGLDPGLTPTAKEVRDAWRRRAIQLHPDSSTGDQGAFVQISAAYQRLRKMFGEP